MAGSIIFPGVIVGKQAIVGAGSSVIKDVDAFAVVAGNPVHLILGSILINFRSRNSRLICKALLADLLYDIRFKSRMI